MLVIDVPEGRSLSVSVGDLATIKERAATWRESHDGESLITGSADGWLVLDTLDYLISEVERYRAYPPKKVYRVELATGEVRKISANYVNTPGGFSADRDGISVGIVGRGPVAWFATDAVKAIFAEDEDRG